MTLRLWWKWLWCLWKRKTRTFWAFSGLYCFVVFVVVVVVVAVASFFFSGLDPCWVLGACKFSLVKKLWWEQQEQRSSGSVFKLCSSEFKPLVGFLDLGCLPKGRRRTLVWNWGLVFSFAFGCFWKLFRVCLNYANFCSREDGWKYNVVYVFEA